MTAVDHAELKRAEALLESRCKAIDLHYGRFPDSADRTMEDTAKAIRLVLSEIEGLKAERDAGSEAGTEPTPEQIEPFARQWCISNGIDPDEPTPPHGEWPRWYDEAGPFAAMWKTISAHLRTQAPDSWRPDREAVARTVRRAIGDAWIGEHQAEVAADAILALRPQAPESGGG